MIQFLEFLRSHNDLYSDIEINTANLPADILGLQHFKTEEDTIYSKLLKCLDEAIEVQLESLLGEETLDDPLPELRPPSMEATTFVSEIPSQGLYRIKITKFQVLFLKTIFFSRYFTIKSI